jgi:alkylation response protein AidB-like acyl-CoA dehydrogenase
MNFDMSEKQKEWLNRVQAFMKTHVRPAVPIYDKQDAEGPRWKVIPILEELKKKAKAEGLWNMFMPPNAHEDDEFRGAGLTNLEYAMLSEEMGRQRSHKLSLRFPSSWLVQDISYSYLHTHRKLSCHQQGLVGPPQTEISHQQLLPPEPLQILHLRLQFPL